jgi:RNA polymerase sigma-70 factor (ECF subfamily)
MEQEFKLKLYSLQLLDDSQMSIDEVEKQICRAIDSLPERCREIFIRIREEKQSYAQVAEELDISIKTVDAQLQKAVSRLKEMISSSG